MFINQLLNINRKTEILIKIAQIYDNRFDIFDIGNRELKI